MNCYDCYVNESSGTSAVGLCHSCGSALCSDHLRMTRPFIHRMNGMGVSHGPAPARLILCATCHAAQPTGLPAA